MAVTTGKAKVGGACFRAPLGTALPTDTTTALNAAFVSLGYVSEDGLTNGDSPSTDNVKDWSGNVVFSMETEKTDTFKFKLIEATDINVLKAVYGDSNVTGTLSAGIVVKANATQQAAVSWVFDMVMADNVAKRIVVPKAAVTEIAEISYKGTEVVGYELTITAYPDANGDTHIEHMKG